ncbi:MAG: M42 family metallopeptidase [Fimbriimonadaceae bacterium]|nr:M42 family metallopeptidase [Fimbriimonadaceae bacterium]
MPRLDISMDYLLRLLEDLINTPSPTGATDWVMGFVENELDAMGITGRRTNKGAIVANLSGIKHDRPRGLTAHVDTLGAIVAEIKPSGRLRLSALNGVMWPTVESEGVTVTTRTGQIRGSIVLTNGAIHVNREATTAKRDADSLEVRLDERTNSAEETRLLGIEVGDIVSFDPRYEHSQSGFVRSRFLDDKAGVACLLAAMKALNDAGLSVGQDSVVLFSNFEEVGHGGSEGLPMDLSELVVIDMACIGSGQNGDEFHCSVCLKDSSGPYSRELSDKLRLIADSAGVELKPDVYPYYGSDGSQYWRAGGAAQVALIGPGVDTSHGYERTHIDALRDTATLLAEYLLEE